MSTETKKPIFPICMSEEEFMDLNDSYAGICLKCGEIFESGYEPDADNCRCEVCDSRRVCGLENALIMGKIDIT